MILLRQFGMFIVHLNTVLVMISQLVVLYYNIGKAK